MALPVRHRLAGFPPTVSPASHAVEADGWVHFTGLLGRDPTSPDALPPGIVAQTDGAQANLQQMLSALGLRFENLVSVRLYLTNFERDYAAMNVAYAAHIPPDARPTRVCIGVTALALGALIEIEAVAKR